MSENANKQHLTLGIVGPPNAGKHILEYHLMFDLDGLQEKEIKAANDRAATMGKSNFSNAAFSAFLDIEREADEQHLMFRERCHEFFTDTKKYGIYSPSHIALVKNFITGSVKIDMMLISTDTEFNETNELSKLYALLARILGIKHIIIGINKMDSEKASYSESSFNEIKNKIIEMLVETGWSKEFIDSSIPILPISGFMGDNLVTKSVNMEWWNGTDITCPNSSHKEKITIVTLKDALEKITPINHAHDIEKNMRVSLSGVYNMRNKTNRKKYDDIVTGYLAQGKLSTNDEVIFVPTHTTDNPCTGKIVSIEYAHKKVDTAIVKCNYGFFVEGLTKENMPKSNDIMILKNDNSIRRVNSFTCHIKILNNSEKIRIGNPLNIIVGTGRTTATLTKINWKITNNVKQCDPILDLNIYDDVEFVFEPTKPLVVDSFENCEELGLIAMIEERNLIFVGRIIEVEFCEQ